jgi:hypothetical protein
MVPVTFLMTDGFEELACAAELFGAWEIARDAGALKDSASAATNNSSLITF